MALGILGAVSAIASIVGTGAKIIGGIKQAKAAREAAQQQAALAREQARIQVENARLAAEDFEIQADIGIRESEFQQAKVLEDGLYSAQIINEQVGANFENAQIAASILNYRSEKTVEQMIREINDIKSSADEVLIALQYENAIDVSDIEFDTAVQIDQMLLASEIEQETLGVSAKEAKFKATVARQEAGAIRDFGRHQANKQDIRNKRAIASLEARLLGGGMTLSGSTVDVIYDQQLHGDIDVMDLVYESELRANTKDIMSLLNEYSASQSIRESQLVGETAAYEASISETRAEADISNLNELTKIRAETIESRARRQTVLTQTQAQTQADLYRLTSAQQMEAAEKAVFLGEMRSDKAIKDSVSESARLERSIMDIEDEKDRTFEHADRVALELNRFGNRSADLAIKRGNTMATNAILGTIGAVAGGIGEFASIKSDPTLFPDKVTTPNPTF